MEITQKTNCEIRVKAVLDEQGDCAVSVIAAAPYGKRSATEVLTAINPADRAKVKAALGDVLKKYCEPAAAAAIASAAKARDYARQKGEKL